jgi:hypothetical protein
VRFQIGDTHWERLIDRPGRFEKKAHFRKGGTYKGHCWIPPRLTMEDIAKADEILIAEGIFDAVALCQVRKVAVSAMSTNNWPEHSPRCAPSWSALAAPSARAWSSPSTWAARAWKRPPNM